MFMIITKTVLNFLFDTLFSQFVINFCVVCIWRIVWEVQDLYIVNNTELNSWMSIFVYYICIILIRYKQLNEIETTECNGQLMTTTLRHRISLHFFIIIFSIANISLWRGVWNLKSFYLQNEDLSLIISGLLSIFGLFIQKRACSLTCQPFFVEKDYKQVVYQVSPTSMTHEYFTPSNSGDNAEVF
jgi:hypothetical protein